MDQQSIQLLEDLKKELEKSKQSERKMLESLVSQTSLLAETKESLEEAKLEISSLKDSIRILEKSSKSKSKKKKKNGLSMEEEEEIAALKNDLKLAMEAEEKSKIAMDELAIVLKEVMTEANETKERLSGARAELAEARAESEELRSQLKNLEAFAAAAAAAALNANS